MVSAIVINILLLGAFKYFNFFVGSLLDLFALFHFTLDFTTTNIILPIGISFYTFQLLAYVIDVYYGKEKVCHDLLDFSLYVSWFPQLVAGPIERSTHLLPILTTPRTITPEKIHHATQLILMGLFKKMLLADGVAPIVDQCFSTNRTIGGGACLIGVYLFAIQIYGDFAGYTDIARGISSFFGIDLSLNFRQPYLASNITDFWRRWHISLSSWLKDYLYIPLGGNRKGRGRTYINNMLTMLLCGLWHGAGWNFVLWGGLHGVYLAGHKLMLHGRKASAEPNISSKKTFLLYWMKVFCTFQLACFGWIFFRSSTLPDALSLIHHILSPAGFFREVKMPLAYLFFFGICTFIVDITCQHFNSEVPFPRNAPIWTRALIYASMIILIVSIGSNHALPFIYFQF